MCTVQRTLSSTRRLDQSDRSFLDDAAGVATAGGMCCANRILDVVLRHSLKRNRAK
jgi:hypothetical protein